VRASGWHDGGRYSREAENLQGIPVVYCIQSHDHLEYATKALVMVREVGERSIYVLRNSENPEVNIHFPGCCCRVVAQAEACPMKTYEEFTFNRQVDNGLNDHSQYVESTVQRVWEDLDPQTD